ncbi:MULTISPECIES: LacI family DNA-binding transcriptional regulator [unclassified Agarivorans]|uniref:LacI family DNA-binding transcriptional regulator n=1 Tax=unclassified Agarivorans TaxID=2636026 RepID=UPI003D7D72A0
MATIREVSELANVSQATVSRVINGNKKVSETTRVRVEAAMRDLGYRPNSFAQALASSRSTSIGMVVSSLSGPFFGPIMHEVEQELRANGHHLVATSGDDIEEREREAIGFLLSRQVDALILHVTMIGDDELIEISKQGRPLVLINRFVPELANSCIFLDNELGGYLATKHLLDLGHRSVACICGPMNKQDSRDRVQGYRIALAEQKVAFDPNLVAEGSYDEDGGLAPARKLIQRDVNFTAVFCGNDNIALGVYDVLAEQRKQVGKDVSVVGYDDVLLSRYLRPKLTTVHFPVVEMGKAAARLVLKKISGKGDMEAIELTPELVVRESTAQPLSTE